MVNKSSTKEKVISGWAFHCHHDVLVEVVTDYDSRRDYIQAGKPHEEIELRLRLFKMIPVDRLPYDLVEAGAAYDEAGTAYNEARTAYDEAEAAYNKARAAYDEAGTAYHEAEAAYHKAEAAYNEAEAAYHEARAARQKARAAYYEARATYYEARTAYHKAEAAYDEARAAFTPYFEQLHSELCPNCPWDGKTIFTEGGDLV